MTLDGAAQLVAIHCPNEWTLDPTVCSYNGNGTLLRKHHGLVNSCDWHTMQFLSEIINIRDGVFNYICSSLMVSLCHGMS